MTSITPSNRTYRERGSRRAKAYQAGQRARKVADKAKQMAAEAAWQAAKDSAYAAGMQAGAAVERQKPNAIAAILASILWGGVTIVGASFGLAANLDILALLSPANMLGKLIPISNAEGSAYPFAPLDIATPFLIDDSPPGSYDFTLIDPATSSTSVKVPSPCQGTIVDAGMWGGYGNGLDLQCSDGMVVRMTHFASLAVTTGAAVASLSCCYAAS